MKAKGVKELFFKRLSPNDNSKNQIYLGGDYTALNVLPYGEVIADQSGTDSKRDRFKANLDFLWIDDTGSLFEAPTAQLILYPKYPEIRLSGFLMGADKRPSKLLNSRTPDRVLFFGITNTGEIICHAIGPENPLRLELGGLKIEAGKGILIEIPLSTSTTDTQSLLLSELLRINTKGWIDSSKLQSDGVRKPYNAQNGGGYTLEAELGILPNGRNEPDFHGWEIKQHGSPSLTEPLKGNAVTLITPEPDGGFYKDKGGADFVRKFGYPDISGIIDRLNFGGIHRFGNLHPKTGLEIRLIGFDIKTSKITDIDGGILLATSSGEQAALWHFKTLIEKWQRKHAKAAIIPSKARTIAGQKQYHYGEVVGLGRNSTITDFLRGLQQNLIYYDPGIKLENATGASPKFKPRSQFRISPKDIPQLYQSFELKSLKG